MNQSSLFANPKDADQLCLVLKCYVEEWGAENVVVHAPYCWRDYGYNNLGRVRLEFCTLNSIELKVVENGVQRLCFQTNLLPLI